MFEAILSLITTVVDPKSLGGTGYIDGIPFSGPVKGEDASGRKFFALPILVTERTSGVGYDDTHAGRAMTVFFQRYSDQADFWVECGSHCGQFAGQSALTHTSGFRREALTWVEPLLEKLLKGERVEYEVPKKYHGWDKVTKSARMLRNEEFPKNGEEA